MSHSRQNRPWVPHAGEQDDGSLHKLPQIMVVAQGNNAKLKRLIFFIGKTTSARNAAPVATEWKKYPLGALGALGPPRAHMALQGSATAQFTLAFVCPQQTVCAEHC